MREHVVEILGRVILRRLGRLSPPGITLDVVEHRSEGHVFVWGRWKRIWLGGRHRKGCRERRRRHRRRWVRRCRCPGSVEVIAEDRRRHPVDREGAEECKVAREEGGGGVVIGLKDGFHRRRRLPRRVATHRAIDCRGSRRPKLLLLLPLQRGRHCAATAHERLAVVV